MDMDVTSSRFGCRCAERPSGAAIQVLGRSPDAKIPPSDALR
jgi:hypothetical protein